MAKQKSVHSKFCEICEKAESSSCEHVIIYLLLKHTGETFSTDNFPTHFFCLFVWIVFSSFKLLSKKGMSMHSTTFDAIRSQCAVPKTPHHTLNSVLLIPISLHFIHYRLVFIYYYLYIYI